MSCAGWGNAPAVCYQTVTGDVHGNPDQSGVLLELDKQKPARCYDSQPWPSKTHSTVNNCIGFTWHIFHTWNPVDGKTGPISLLKCWTSRYSETVHPALSVGQRFRWLLSWGWTQNRKGFINATDSGQDRTYSALQTVGNAWRSSPAGMQQDRLSLRDCELGNCLREAERGGPLNHSLPYHRLGQQDGELKKNDINCMSQVTLVHVQKILDMCAYTCYPRRERGKEACIVHSYGCLGSHALTR